MYLYLYVTFFVIIISNIKGNPVNNEFYNFLTSSKCPYLLSKYPDYLKECNVLPKKESIKAFESEKLNEENKNYALCTLFYNTFKKMCSLINNQSKPVKEITTINSVPQTFQQQDNVCLNLKKPVMETLKKDLSTNVCIHICVDYDGNVEPICSAIAYMHNTTEQLNQQLNQSVVKPSFVEAPANGDGTHKFNGVRVGDTINDKKEQETKDNGHFLAASSDNKTPKAPVENIINSGATVVQTEKTDTIKGQQQKDSASGEKKNVTTTEIHKETPKANTHIANNIGDNLSAITPITGKQSLVSKKPEDNEAPSSITNMEGSIGSQITLTADNKDSVTKDGNTVIVNQESNQPKLSGFKKSDVETKPTSEINGNGKVEDEQSPKTYMVTAGDTQNLPDPLGNNDKEHEDDTGDYGNFNEAQPKSSEVKSKVTEKSKPFETDEDSSNIAANYQNQNIDDSESYFFSYFMMVCIMFICGYVAYHNKQKILALVVEGRKGKRQSRTRRPNSANYRKLDSNLEEAVTSACNKSTTQVIY